MIHFDSHGMPHLRCLQFFAPAAAPAALASGAVAGTSSPSVAIETPTSTEPPAMDQQMDATDELLALVS